MTTQEYPWLWDVRMDAGEYERLLAGGEPGRTAMLDADWAMLRLIEYAPYRELRRLLPVARFMSRWSELSHCVRSSTRRVGMEFLFEWFRRQEGGAHA